MNQPISLGHGSYVKSATDTWSTMSKERKWEGMPCDSRILRLKCRVNRIQISETAHPPYHGTETMHGSVWFPKAPQWEFHVKNFM